MGSSESKSSDVLAMEEHIAQYDIDPDDEEVRHWCDSDRSLRWSDLLSDRLISKLGVPSTLLANHPPSHCYGLFVALIYVMLFFLGTSGNGTVIWIFLRNKSLRTPSNTLLASLSLSDMVMVFMGIFLVNNAWHCGPAWSPTLCELYGFTGSSSGLVSINTIMVMSIDRRSVIANPLKQRWLTKWRAVGVIALIWTYAITLSLAPYTHFANRFVPEGNMFTCSFDFFAQDIRSKLFFGSFVVFAYFTPMVVIIWSYYGIIGSVMRSEKAFNQIEEKSGSVKGQISTVASSMKPKSSKDKLKARQEIKIAKIAIGLCGLWFVAWTPYALAAITQSFFPEVKVRAHYAELPGITAKLSAIVNPFVYTLSHPGFRKALDKMLMDDKKKKKMKKASKYADNNSDTMTMVDD
ncbi:Opsin Rh4 [Halotydeus destructor]|nr:Opsin Rh4 [Halotydeus destructor]